MVRERSRALSQVTEYRNSGGLIATYPGSMTREYFRESAYPGSNNCFHWTATPGSYRANIHDGTYFVGVGNILPYNPVPFVNFVGGLIEPMTLNRSKLLTSSDFGALQAIAELDDTLGLLTTKFWKELSYGSITWGILPLVSDIQAVADQIGNLAKRQAQNRQSYEDERSTSVSGTYDIPVWPRVIRADIEGEWKQRLTGESTTPAGNPLLEVYDRVGFHPDIATAWDLVPLSFVVDYLIPIGDYLEQSSNRGWIKVVNFSGWSTASFSGKITFKGVVSSPAPSETIAYGSTEVGSFDLEIFHRSRLLGSVLSDEDESVPLPSIKMPNMRQLINTAYLAGSRR